MLGKEIRTTYEGLFSLKEKVVLVVGAAGGLAVEACLGLAQFGATLALADMEGGGLGKVSSILESRGVSSWGQAVDVQDESSVAALLNAVTNKFGRLDIMINFAGVAAARPIEEIDAAEFQRVINVNLLGSFLLAKHSLSVMTRHGSGKIILLGSVQGQIGRPFNAQYSASKGGVHSMVRAMAVETARKNIQVNSIAPVFTLTPMSERVVGDPATKEKIIATIPMGRLGMPSDLVGAIIYLASGASDFFTGQTMFVDGGCTIS
jgi:NAD(P)-dependent dehydrogenase (short-subunit alcohol dehydrogenase family)